MIEYQSKVENKMLSELKDLVPNADKRSTKEVFVYVKDLADSRAKIANVEKENRYDTTLIKLISQLKEKLEYYEGFNWVIECLNSACLKEDDWKEIRRIMNNNSIDGKWKLVDLEQLKINEHREQIELIHKKYDRKRKEAEEKDAKERKQKAKQRGKELESVNAELENLRIQNMKDGLDKQIAQLNEEKRQKIQRAKIEFRRFEGAFRREQNRALESDE